MKKIKVPVYTWSGWHDNYSRGNLWFIDGVASRHRQLWIHASTHHGTSHAGEVGAPYDDGSGAGFSSAPPEGADHAWLDRFLKGVKNGIEKKPQVRSSTSVSR